MADELGDVAFTALVATASLGYDPRKVLAQVAAKVRKRLTGPQPPNPTPPQAAVGGSIRRVSRVAEQESRRSLMSMVDVTQKRVPPWRGMWFDRAEPVG